MRVFADVQMPEVKFVANTPFCDVGCAVDEATGQAIIVSALDNLLKGARDRRSRTPTSLGFDEREGVIERWPISFITADHRRTQIATPGNLMRPL